MTTIIDKRSGRGENPDAKRRQEMLDRAGLPYEDPQIAADVFYSLETLELEKQKLWPNTWLCAGRKEEVPDIGDFIEFRIADQSIVIVRVSEDQILAHHNVCQHRGRALVSGAGHISHFKCGFHGWRWNLDGTCREIQYENEFNHLCRDDVPLPKVLCAEWGGFIYINMNLEAEPLLEYLDPIPTILAPFEYEKMRYRWYKSGIAQCNWKVAMEAFMEQYHLVATHPQYAPYFDERTITVPHGKHAVFMHAPDAEGFGGSSPMVGELDPDPRKRIQQLAKVTEDQLKAIYTDLHMEAARRLSDLPDGVTTAEAYQHFFDDVKRLAIERGVGELKATRDDVEKAGIDWSIFPNTVTLPGPAGALWYRFRPNGNDPETCIMDVWSLARFVPGAEPKLVREFYDDWRKGSFGNVLEQDFRNMAEVQRGIHSRGFSVLRLNPVQEATIANFHKHLDKYLR